MKTPTSSLSTQINIKDYIEVNSAISLAVNELGESNQVLNFKKTSVSEKISQMVKIETGKATKEGKKDKITTKSWGEHHNLGTFLYLNHIGLKLL